VGLWDWSIAAAHSQVVAQLDPQPAQVAQYDELVQIFADSYTALAPIYTRLAQFTATSATGE
jgi:hypothetical protein